jgi:hypothetical protein
MVLGMSLEAFTVLHVIISLIAIASGLIVLGGMIRNQRMNALTALFLATTVLTSVTGFLFPITKITPGLIIGGISMLVLALAIVARYQFALAGAWRSAYVISAVTALYFNCFVLVVQSFRKAPQLKALAPTEKEPPFAITQFALLIAFIVLGTLAVKRFRPDVLAASTRAATA